MSSHSDQTSTSTEAPTSRSPIEDGRRWRRRLLVQFGVSAAVVAAAVAGAVALAGGFGSDPGATGASGATPVLGEPAPPLAGETLEGDEFDLADHDGDVRVVNVWASWCTVCKEEHPDLLAAAERLRPYGVQFVGVNSMDRRDDAMGMAEEMADQMGVDHYPNVFDPDGGIAVEWGVYGIPETFVIDADGRVRAKRVGAVTQSWLEEHVAEHLPEE